MYRPIKFRAWDGEKMITETTVPIADINEHIAAFGGVFLMQFTGLKDKNGKEIYEGDIVTQHKNRMSNFDEINSEIIWYKDYCGFAVATLDDTNKERFLERMTKNFEVEIIGNIYDDGLCHFDNGEEYVFYKTKSAIYKAWKRNNVPNDIYKIVKLKIEILNQ